MGDLDHVLQVDSPSSVASFLQRIGRTGRRAGSTRNATILTTSDEQLLQAAGLLLLWSRGFVEAVTPPPQPRHIEAQQLLALVLQEGRVGSATWREWWSGSPLMRDVDGLAEHLLATGLLDSDGGMLHIGPEAEARYGRRHFMELMAVFTAAPEFTVINGAVEIGSIDPQVLTADRPEGAPTRFTLAGRAWQVSYVDYKRRRCFVVESETAALTRWTSVPGGLGHELTRARRDVLLGEDPPVTLSRRAMAGLARLREERGMTVGEGRLVVERRGRDTWWWTYAGLRANLTLLAALPDLMDPRQRPDSDRVRLRSDVDRDDFAGAVGALALDDVQPRVDARAVNGLKFADVLPDGLAARTLAVRLADPVGAAWAAEQSRVWRGSE